MNNQKYESVAVKIRELRRKAELGDLEAKAELERLFEQWKKAVKKEYGK
ncbi:hypothetical protein MUO79_01860 [Candidatus Bathyarchaeota archaeon]|nr:hypothetical protein [Candidatus Bathyarchaeota archaeon]